MLVQLVLSIRRAPAGVACRSRLSNGEQSMLLLSRLLLLSSLAVLVWPSHGGSTPSSMRNRMATQHRCRPHIVSAQEARCCRLHRRTSLCAGAASAGCREDSAPRCSARCASQPVLCSASLARLSQARSGMLCSSPQAQWLCLQKIAGSDCRECGPTLQAFCKPTASLRHHCSARWCGEGSVAAVPWDAGRRALHDPAGGLALPVRRPLACSPWCRYDSKSTEHGGDIVKDSLLHAGYFYSLINSVRWAGSPP